ncbi:MAG: alanine racemase [Tissierella sp.]|uniref:alanine racemase n=1 Tax=Tissierella sp. TaxID=41274 RepID=UPI003F94C585
MKYLEGAGATIVEINLDNLAYNIKKVRNYIKKDTLIMAVVKANAYGHGAVSAAKVFLENGADRLGVSVLREGIELRKKNIKAPILLLNYTPSNQYRDVVKYDIIPTIFRYEDARILSDLAVSMNKSINIHIKIDTGMSRIGFLPNEDSIEDILKISKLANIKIEGIFTHFAKSDELDKNFTKTQFKRFMDVVNKLEEKGLHIDIKHVSNSAAVIDIGEYNLDMVRPGIILYGYYPSAEVKRQNLHIKPAMTLKSSISNIKTIKKGTGVGYNHLYIAEKDVRIATIPIGYADGYSRLLAEKAYGSINEKKTEVVGKVCMDQTMLDISSIDNLGVGNEVKLFGYDDKSCPTVEKIASWIGTSNYEIICMISRRVPRVYMKNDKLDHVVDYILN